MTAHTENRTGKPRWRKALALLTAVTSVLLAVAGTGAAGAPQQPRPGQVPGVPPSFPPPPLGTVFPLEIVSSGVVLSELDTITGNDSTPNAPEQFLTTGPMEGDTAFRVEASDPLDPWSLSLKMTGFSLTTADTAAPSSPSDAEQGSGLGKVTIEQSDVSITPASLLQMTSQFPPRWEQTMFLDFTMTIENPPEQLRAATATEQSDEFVVLTPKMPAEWTGRLSDFPPEGEVYQLQSPIELVQPDNPEQTVASIDKFPVKVGGI